MDKNDNTKKLFQKKIDANYVAYINDLQGMTSSELIDKAEKIAATKQVYQELKNGGCNTDHLEYLLRFQNPLEVVRDQWLNEQGKVSNEDMEYVLWSLADKRGAKQDYELDEAFCEPEQYKGMRLC